MGSFKVILPLWSLCTNPDHSNETSSTVLSQSTVCFQIFVKFIVQCCAIWIYLATFWDTPTPVSPKAEGLESKATKLSECTKGPAGSTTLPLTSGMRNDKNDPMLRPSDVDKLAAEVNEEVKDIGMGLGHVGTSTSLNILHQFWTYYYWISQKNERWCTHMVI